MILRAGGAWRIQQRFQRILGSWSAAFIFSWPPRPGGESTNQREETKNEGRFSTPVGNRATRLRGFGFSQFSISLVDLARVRLACHGAASPRPQANSSLNRSGFKARSQEWERTKRNLRCLLPWGMNQLSAN
jgi:hypothetical protein